MLLLAILIRQQLTRADFDLPELNIRIFTEDCPADICHGSSCKIKNFQRAHCDFCNLNPDCQTAKEYYWGEMCGRRGIIKIVKRECKDGAVGNILSSIECLNEGQCYDAVCYFSYDIVCDSCSGLALFKQDPKLGCWECKDIKLDPQENCLKCKDQSLLLVNESCYTKCSVCSGKNNDCYYIDD